MGQEESISEYVPMSDNELTNRSFLNELKQATAQGPNKEESRQCFIAEHLTSIPFTRKQIIDTIMLYYKDKLLKIANLGYNSHNIHPRIIKIRHNESIQHNCMEEYTKWATVFLTMFAEELSLQTKLSYCAKTDCNCLSNIHVSQFAIRVTW